MKAAKSDKEMYQKVIIIDSCKFYSIEHHENKVQKNMYLV